MNTERQYELAEEIRREQAEDEAYGSDESDPF